VHLTCTFAYLTCIYQPTIVVRIATYVHVMILPAQLDTWTIAPIGAAVALDAIAHSIPGLNILFNLLTEPVGAAAGVAYMMTLVLSAQQVDPKTLAPEVCMRLRYQQQLLPQQAVVAAAVLLVAAGGVMVMPVVAVLIGAGQETSNTGCG
jgi:hypothetical protein